MSCKSCSKRTRSYFCEDCWSKLSFGMQNALQSTVGQLYMPNNELKAVLVQQAVDYLQLRRLLLKTREYAEVSLKVQIDKALKGQR